MIYRESADKYQSRIAVSAGFLWDLVNQCPAIAYTRSVFNPKPLQKARSLEFDIGTATHLLTLEGSDFAERTALIDYDSYQSKDAQAQRDQAYVDGRTPLRKKDYALVDALHEALRDPTNNVKDLLFGEGDSEVSYTWTHELEPRWTVACKARADRITPYMIVDLKTATSAAPEAFSKAMASNGHHLRAAWYQDGFVESSPRLSDPFPHEGIPRTFPVPCPDYIFVVASKTPPHLVTVFTTGSLHGDNWFPIDAGAIHKGREAYGRGLRVFRQCMESGRWPGYIRRQDQIIGLPTWYEYRLAEEESK